MKSFRIVGLVFLICGILFFVNPASAANKLVDQGTVYSSKEYSYPFKYNWETFEYKNGNMEVIAKIYIEKNGKWNFLGTESILLQKISKTLIKASRTNCHGHTFPEYKKTDHSIKYYYWHNFRPYIIEGYFMPIGYSKPLFS